MKQIRSILLILLFSASFSFSTEAQVSPEVEWTMIFDGYNTTDFAGLVTDSQGNTYSGVNYSSNFSIPELKKDFPYGYHVSRALVKMDPSGKAKWAVGMQSNFDGRIQNMLVTSEDNIIVAGFCDGVSTYESRHKKSVEQGFPKPKGQFHRPQFVYIASYSSSGNLNWVHSYHQAWGESVGLAQNSKGEIYWTFFHKGNLRDGSRILDSLGGNAHSSERSHLMIFDEAGNEKLFKNLKTEAERAQCPKVAIDHEDNVIFYGLYKSKINLLGQDSLTNDGYYETNDTYIAKFDQDLKLLWKKNIGGRNSQVVEDLVIGDSNEIYFTGLYNYECVVGDQIAVIHRSKYEYKSGNSFFYGKLSSKGLLEFMHYKQQDRYYSRVSGKSLTIDDKGYVHLAGVFSDSLSFADHLPELYTHRDRGASFISIWDEDSIISIRKIIETQKSWNFIGKMSFTNNRVSFGGMYYGKTTLKSKFGTFKFTHIDHGRSSFACSYEVPPLPERKKKVPDNVEDLLTEIGQCEDVDELDSFVWFPIGEASSKELIDTNKESDCGVNLKKISASLFPIPTDGKITLRLDGFEGAVQLQVLSSNAQLVYSQELLKVDQQKEIEFDMSSLAAGTYYMYIKQQGYHKSIKFIKT